jgi:phage portal protein BeeE
MKRPRRVFPGAFYFTLVSHRITVQPPRDHAALAREGYARNAIVYRAVRLIAENVGSLAFGAPPMLLAILGDNIYSNFQEANRVFWRQSVLSLAGRIGCALSHWLALAFGDGLVLLSVGTDRIEALSADRAALWDRVSKAPFMSVKNAWPPATGRSMAATYSSRRNRNKHPPPVVLLLKPPVAGRLLNGTKV